MDYRDPANKRKIASREQKISNIRAGVFTTKKELELTREVNLGSPIDLPLLLYSKKGFNFPVIKYTKDKKTNRDTDKPSTDEDTLVELRLTVKDPESPKAIFLDNLLELRGLKKMYTTYIEGWHDKVQDDSKLHGRFLIHGTTSGRLSCIGGDTKVLTQYGEIPIIDIKDWIGEGLCAMTKDGWQLIENFIYKGIDDMYEVTLEDGTSIQCTLDHKFITNKGTKRLREIYNKYRNTIDSKIKLLRYVPDYEQ